MTKNALVSDIILRVTRGKPSDDLELEPRQVAFWIDMVLAGLMKQSLDEKLRRGVPVDPAYICYEECSELLIKDKNCVDCPDNIYYVLKREPMNLFRDRGVLRVATSDGAQVDKASLQDIDDLNNMTFAKPTLSHLVYYRKGCNINLLGVTKNTMHLVDLDIWYVPHPNLEELDDNDEVFVGEDILAAVAEEVEKIARRQLYQSGEDMENDAQQDLKAKPS